MSLVDGIRVLGLTAVAAVVAGASAWADSAREQDFASFIRPGYPLFLAQAGMWGMDPGRMRELADKAAKGLAAVAPDDCDGAGFKRNLCGLKLWNEPSTSMAPTLRERELIAARPYGGTAPRRGDIIVFSSKSFVSEQPQILVKRLIGMPGDTVEMRGGTVYVNDAAFATKPTDQTMSDISGSQARILEETTPEGRHYLIAMNDQSIEGADDAGPFNVPEGHYFVLGDNRHNSADSRFPDQIGENGFIPAQNVSGRVVTLLVSPDVDRIGLVVDPMP
jgi:signal peptidase I